MPTALNAASDSSQLPVEIHLAKDAQSDAHNALLEFVQHAAMALISVAEIVLLVLTLVQTVKVQQQHVLHVTCQLPWLVALA